MTLIFFHSESPVAFAYEVRGLKSNHRYMSSTVCVHKMSLHQCQLDLLLSVKPATAQRWLADVDTCNGLPVVRMQFVL